MEGARVENQIVIIHYKEKIAFKAIKHPQKRWKCENISTFFTNMLFLILNVIGYFTVLLWVLWKMISHKNDMNFTCCGQPSASGPCSTKNFLSYYNFVLQQFACCSLPILFRSSSYLEFCFIWKFKVDAVLHLSPAVK